MNSMVILAFAAAAGTGVAGQMVGEPAHAPAMAARHDCSKLPALCTGAVTVSGTGTTLTYLCPTTQAPVSTVHVTVTATTTVTDFPHGPSVLASTGDIPASGTPHAPAPPGKHSETSSMTSAAVTSSTDVEVTTTTTIHSTLTTVQTLTLTRKTSSLDILVPSPTAINSTILVISSTHVTHSVPTLPAVNSTQIVSASSATGHWSANSTRTRTFPSIPSTMPPFTLIEPSAIITTSLPVITASKIINTTAPVHDPCFPNDPCWESTIDGPFWTTSTDYPSGTAPSGGFPIPTSEGTGYSKLPIKHNATATRRYMFPTPQQARGLESSEPAKPSKTGGVGAIGVNIAALVGGVVAALYFA